MRERGLKSSDGVPLKKNLRRSREGAWIEMHHDLSERYHQQGRSREGAWIEIAFSATCAD